MNVLRQYDEGEVADAWERMARRLAPDGLLVEGTCDELGRIVTWVAMGADAVPRTLTVSLRLAGLEHPSIAAERLPKALIHRNVPGERVHGFLRALDEEWDRAAGMSPFGPVQRWEATLSAVRDAGWPLQARAAGGSARSPCPGTPSPRPEPESDPRHARRGVGGVHAGRDEQVDRERPHRGDEVLVAEPRVRQQRRRIEAARHRPQASPARSAPARCRRATRR